MTTITHERTRLYREVQMVLAGCLLVDGFHALQDCLATLIIQVAEDRAEAEAIAERVPADLMSSVRANWDAVRSLAASAGEAGSA